jgi:hypothetical protein
MYTCEIRNITEAAIEDGGVDNGCATAVQLISAHAACIPTIV